MSFASKLMLGFVLATIIGYFLGSGFSEVLDSIFPVNGWWKISIGVILVIIFGRRYLA